MSQRSAKEGGQNALQSFFIIPVLSYLFKKIISLNTANWLDKIFDDINTTFNFINIDKTISRDMNGKAKVGSGPKTDTGERTVPINSMVKPIIDEILNFISLAKITFCSIVMLVDSLVQI